MSCCRFRGHRDGCFWDRRMEMQRRKFSREFKLEAVKLVRERGVSVSQAARDLDLHENVARASGCVSRWWTRDRRFRGTA